MTLLEAAKQALEALELGQDAFNQAYGGYGYYRPTNPHNFMPDLECCTPEEIANHSAACEAYDKGTYIPDHSDGWTTHGLHVTVAPWGIGTYTDECEEISVAIINLRAAIRQAEKSEQHCSKCANRGRAYGLTQESCCDHCVFQHTSWRKDLFSAAPQPEGK